MKFFNKIKKIDGIGFWIFFIGVFVFNFFIYLTPFLEMFGYKFLSDGLYFGFSFTCHQLNSRSYCIFNNSISDCTLNSSELSYEKTKVVYKNNQIGYKLPVCSRDIGIYLSLLIGAFVWGFLNRKNLSSFSIPSKIILILCLLPIGIDGLAQFLGIWESSNPVRFLTGFLAGFSCSFFIIPILNELIKNS